MITSVSRSFKVQHLTEFGYEKPVQRAVMLLRLQPRSNDRQNLVSFKFDIEPESVPVEFTDSFGNICHMMDFQSSDNSRVTIRSYSEVKTQASNVSQNDLESVTWDQVSESTELIRHWDYLSDSKWVYDSAQLREFATEHGIGRNDTPFSSLKTAAEKLIQALRYESGSTEVDSRIEDCLSLGSGVCQDFTHIMLAIARRWRIPSRYVSGYLHLFPDSDTLVSENASHAWAEFHFPNVGWVGIDATNNELVDDRYIMVAVGRDYNDVAPTKGVIYGGGKSSLRVNVTLLHSGDVRSGDTAPVADQ